MAELQQQATNKHSGLRRGKKSSPRVDLTPMVDLGFLLITFFIFTTVTATPTTMRLVLPDDRPTLTPALASAGNTITFLIDDSVTYCYAGFLNGNLQALTNSTNPIRNTVQQKQAELQKRLNSSKELVVLIKATKNATYNQIVGALDEMVINGVSKYMLLDIEPTELDAIRAFKL